MGSPRHFGARWPRTSPSASDPDRPRRAVASVGCTVAAATWWLAPATALAIAGLFVLGVTTAPLYPIATAQAYAEVPGRAALVAAAAQVFVVVDVAAPWLLGVVADAAGLGAALTTIAVAPLFVLAVTLVMASGATCDSARDRPGSEGRPREPSGGDGPC